jgi:hypothetical protein
MCLRINRIRVKYGTYEADKQANLYGGYWIIHHPLIHMNIGEI